jgi:hypothetical protein
VQFPITGFFADFPANEIKFNLYNERFIAPQGLSQIQAVLSQILLVFFEDHLVDDDALFTLMVFLHEAILDGLSDTKESKFALILDLIEEIKNREKYARIDLFELQAPGDLQIPPTDAQPGMENLSIWFEYAAYLLNQKIGKAIETYFIILRIQEHLMRVSDEIFLDSLNMLQTPFNLKLKRHLKSFQIPMVVISSIFKN